MHKPPTSPVSWEVLSVKWAQAIYSAAASLRKPLHSNVLPLLCQESFLHLTYSCTVQYCTWMEGRVKGERWWLGIKAELLKLWGRWLKGRHEEAVSIVSSTVPESQQKAILTVASTTGGAPPDLWLVHHSSDYRPPRTARQFVVEWQYSRKIHKMFKKWSTSWMFNAWCFSSSLP